MSEVEELDVTGLSCPLPVLRAQRKLRGMKPGAELLVLADDPVAKIDFPHYCEESGNKLLDLSEDGPLIRILLQKTS